MLCGFVIQRVKHGECQSEGKDNILTVREAGQAARVLQLFLGCGVCESTLNAKLMTHCQNPNRAGLICVCMLVGVFWHRGLGLYTSNGEQAELSASI